MVERRAVREIGECFEKEIYFFIFGGLCDSFIFIFCMGLDAQRTVGRYKTMEQVCPMEGLIPGRKSVLVGRRIKPLYFFICEQVYRSLVGRRIFSY